VFIQYIQGKCQRPADLRRLMERWQDELSPTATGWLGGTYGFANNTDTFCAVVRFESREKAMENSSRREQDQWFNEMQKCFIGPLEFANCDEVALMLDGGSDSAGFVQVMRGRVLDGERLRRLVQHDDQLREMRPEIIGGTFAVADDGTFVNTVAFTDEEAARHGEQQEMPEDVADDMAAAVTDITYLDLHDPWFTSPS